MKTMRKRLKLNVVKFAFKKKNGELRYATGTTNIMLLNEMYGLNLEDNGEGTERNGITSYYDLEKMGWRCFKTESLTQIY